MSALLGSLLLLLGVPGGLRKSTLGMATVRQKGVHTELLEVAEFRMGFLCSVASASSCRVEKVGQKSNVLLVNGHYGGRSTYPTFSIE